MKKNYIFLFFVLIYSLHSSELELSDDSSSPVRVVYHLGDPKQISVNVQRALRNFALDGMRVDNFFLGMSHPSSGSASYDQEASPACCASKLFDDVDESGPADEANKNRKLTPAERDALKKERGRLAAAEAASRTREEALLSRLYKKEKESREKISLVEELTRADTRRQYEKELQVLVARQIAFSRSPATSAPTVKVNFCDKNFAFIRLLIEDVAGNVSVCKLGVAENGTPLFVPFSSDYEEVCFLSGSNNIAQKGGVDSADDQKFSWMNLGGLPICQLRKNSSEDKKRVVRHILQMSTEEEEYTLYERLIAPIKPLVDCLKQAQCQSRDGLQPELVNKIFDMLSLRPAVAPGETSYSILDKLNGFCCAEQTMSLFLNHPHLRVPCLDNVYNLHMVVFSKWTPCASCASNLDIMLSDFEGLLRSQVGDKLQKLFVSTKPYSSVKRGLPNAERISTTSSPWRLLYATPKTKETAAGGITPDGTPQRMTRQPTTSTPSQGAQLNSPGSLDKKMLEKDGLTPVKREAGTQMSPPPSASKAQTQEGHVSVREQQQRMLDDALQAAEEDND